MNTEYAVKMGKMVALSILQEESQIKEVEDIEQIVYHEIKNIQKECQRNPQEIINYQNYAPHIAKIIKRIILVYTRISIGSSTEIPQVIKTMDKIIEEFKKYIEEKKKKRKSENKKKKLTLLSFLTFLFKNKEFYLLEKVLVYLLFLNSKKQKKCEICGREDIGIFDDYSAFKLFNSSDYKSDLQKTNICALCSFYTYLQNYYPFLTFKNFNKIKYHFFMEEMDLNKTLWAYEKDFSRFVKHFYINSYILQNPSKGFIVFYEEGQRSSNNNVLAYGRLNIITTLFKMLENAKDKNEINLISNFKEIFFEGKILEKNSSGLLYFCNFIQNDYMPIELEKLYFNTYIENREEFEYNFKSFAKFLFLYLKVKSMEEKEKDLVNPINLGFKLGIDIQKSIIEIGGDFENEKKWLISLSGQMEHTPLTFENGILSIMRRYRINVYSKEFSEIAKDNQKRVEFLIGLLNGFLSFRKKDYLEDQNDQEGSKNIEEDNN
ncbi:MAG: hypothetical protein QXV83_00335 [Candidatus Anstonellaceae archaeon]